MPVFRSQPSRSLMGSVQKIVASGGGRLSPLQEMQADMAAARTVRDNSLAEKARIEAEAARQRQLQQSDPATTTSFATHSAGMDLPSGNRLMAHLNGALEEPSSLDYEDNPNVSAYPVGEPVLQPGQRSRFQNALAAQAANLLGTGKTNAQQLTAAAGNEQDLELLDQASRAPDAESGNRLVAAARGLLRKPYSTNASGVETNSETGDVYEGTQLAGRVRDLARARTATEGARQTELGTRSDRNTATAGLQNARAGAVGRGETGRGGQRISPQQVERWVSDVAKKEWDALDSRARKGMNYEQHVDRVRERFTRASGGVKPVDEINDAQRAIAEGKDMKLVRQRFRQRMGFDLPPAPIESTFGGDEEEGDDD